VRLFIGDHMMYFRVYRSW